MVTRGGRSLRQPYAAANAADTAMFDGVDGDYRRIVLGAPVDGWHCYDASGIASVGPFTARTTADDPMLIETTVGSTLRRCWVRSAAPG
jgi:acetyl-CoA synthetase